MATTSPESALVTSLADYLRDAITAESDLADSEVVDEWPEPTVDLRLSGSRVVVAVLRAGRGATQSRLGGPAVERVTMLNPTATAWLPETAYAADVFVTNGGKAYRCTKAGTSGDAGGPAGTGATITDGSCRWAYVADPTVRLGRVRFEMGQVDQPITIGLWAHRQRLRDDVDLLLAELLNRPMWETISPAVSTTLATAIVSPGKQLVTPTSMDDIWPGVTLEVDSGTSIERLVVQELRPTGFIATPRFTHAAGVALVEVESRRESAAAGLHLRCADHYGNRAHYLFDDSTQILDDVEGGRGSQRQEWRSLRSGTGSIRWSREVTGVVLQRSLTIEIHASATGGPVANPLVIPAF